MNINTLSLLVTSSALLLAGIAFENDRQENRNDLKSEKENILTSIESELGYMGLWLGNSCTSSSLKNKCWDPSYMVYRLGRNEAIKNVITGKYIILLSKELRLTLVEFNQRLSNFEQLIDRSMALMTANPILFIDATVLFNNLSNESLRLKFIQTLYLKYKNGKKLTQPEKMLLVAQNEIRTIHMNGIGDETNPLSLRYTFKKLNNLINSEKNNLSTDPRWKPPFWEWFFITIISLIFVIVLWNIFLIKKGGVILLNMNTILILGILFFASLILGLIKYGSLADQYKGKSWQLKFNEIWNDFINFAIPGLIAYYFILIRWPLLQKGQSLNSVDIILSLIFIIGLFGHLSVMSYNITKGVEAILSRILERK